jgi:RNA polymerase sigma-70 factor (ECF subfamily)
MRSETERPPHRTETIGSASDRRLVAHISAGAPDALAEAYRRHGRLVYGVCRRVLRSDPLAEDVTQDVFLFLWQNPARFDPGRGPLRSWLGVIAHRRSIDRVRAENRRDQRESRLDHTAERVEPTADAFDASWLCSRVAAALARLPEDQRRAVVLAYYGGRSYREVADELSIPEGTAKSRLRLALGRLDAILRDELTDEGKPSWS